jgi:hypothetical protein
MRFADAAATVAAAAAASSSFAIFTYGRRNCA